MLGCFFLFLVCGCESNLIIHFNEGLSIEEAYQFAIDNELTLISMTSALPHQDKDKPILSNICIPLDSTIALDEIYSMLMTLLERQRNFLARRLDEKRIESESIRNSLTNYEAEKAKRLSDPFGYRSYQSIERDLRSAAELIDILEQHIQERSEAIDAPHLNTIKVTKIEASHKGWPLWQVGKESIAKIKKSTQTTDHSIAYACH